jgi:pyruvate,orthophosphate dikinase
MGEIPPPASRSPRNPSTGERRRYYGEFLVNAQGEDVVAGIRTPQYDHRSRAHRRGIRPAIAGKADAGGLCRVPGDLRPARAHYRDMQDLEFTIERGKLWMLQTRSGKRTAKAALKMAVDMADEGLITREEAVLSASIRPRSTSCCTRRSIPQAPERDIMASGLPASPGAATGEIVFTSEEAGMGQGRPQGHSGAGRDQPGGHSRHARRRRHPDFARRHDKPCRRGGARHGHALRLGRRRSRSTATARLWRRRQLKAGDVITLDGSTGQVLKGEVAMLQPELSGDFGLMEWADATRRMKVRTNAETPADAHRALFRRRGHRPVPHRAHVLRGRPHHRHARDDPGRDEEGRRTALAKLLPMQRSGFHRSVRDHAGLPVTIRLLDPPLHEFLPKTDAEIAEVAAASASRWSSSAQPSASCMNSTRCWAIAAAGWHLLSGDRRNAGARDLRGCGRSCRDHRRAGGAGNHGAIGGAARGARPSSRRGSTPWRAKSSARPASISTYQVGTMIELPRAAIRAHAIAEVAEFFSFGTNDLTQTTFGISRDDASSFLMTYQQKGIIEHDPFVTLDIDGVGEMVRIGNGKGQGDPARHQARYLRRAWRRPGIGAVLREIGLDYVSCSPFRVPIARLAAAQAAIDKQA